MAEKKSKPKSINSIELAYEAPLGNGAKARYVLSSKRKLMIEFESEAALRECTIDLLAMSPNSRRLREKAHASSKVDRNLLLSLLLVGLAAIAALLLGLPWTIMAVVLAAVGAILVIYIVKQKSSRPGQQRKYIFVSRVAQVPLVEINFVKQSNKLDRFVVLLQERIQAALAASDLDEKELLAGEMRALRRMMEDGFLDKKLYEKAKRLLLTKAN